MDERELHELFRETARAAPPASFDEQDVLRGSRRATARRRMTVAGGTLTAAAVVAVGGVGIGTGLFGGDEKQPLSVPQTSDPPVETRGPSTEDPGVLMEPGHPSGCGPPDERLANALVSELPEAAGQSPMSADDCPSGAEAVSFTLREGSAQGDVTVILSPVGTVSQEQAKPGERPDGTQQATEQTRSGKMLLVRSDPDDGSPAPPFEKRLDGIAKDLAHRL